MRYVLYQLAFATVAAATIGFFASPYVVAIMFITHGLTK